MKKKKTKKRQSPGDALWRELFPILQELLFKALAPRLKFAEVSEVVSLALVHSKHRHRSDVGLLPTTPVPSAGSPGRPAWVEARAGSLAAWALAEGFVEDAERVAEFCFPHCSAIRRVEIRKAFHDRLWPLMQHWVEVALVDRGRSAPGDAVLDEVTGALAESFFFGEAFEAVTSAYQPGKGMAFKGFLEQKALWASLDAVKKWVAGQPVILSIDSLAAGPDPYGIADAFGPAITRDEGEAPTEVQPLPDSKDDAGDDASEEDSNAVEEAHSELAELFEWVASQGMNERRRALLFLHFKVYVEPEIIPPFVAQMVDGGLERLRQDYEKAQEELEERRCTFHVAARDWDDAQALVGIRLQTLRQRFGVTPKGVLELNAIAGRCNLMDLEEEKEAADPVREERWLCELDYLWAVRTRDLALRRREIAHAALVPYWTVRGKPWVRTQKELEERIGAPSGTLGRELAEIRNVLKAYPFRRGLSLDLGEDE